MPRRYRLHAIALMLLLSCTTAPQFALGQDNGPMLAQTPRDRLVLMLSAFHEAPDLAALEALDLDLQTALIEVAADEEVAAVARGRALTALSAFPSDTTRQFAGDFVAREANGDLFLLGRATQLVGELGIVSPAWAVEQLRPLVAHTDPTVRELAVRSFGQLRTTGEVREAVDDVLLQVVVAERAPAVQAALREVLDREPVLRPAAKPTLHRVPGRR